SIWNLNSSTLKSSTAPQAQIKNHRMTLREGFEQEKHVRTQNKKRMPPEGVNSTPFVRQV
ncbi:MAG: hypothetical protein IIT86_03050, partial [Oscillospiraceae bacterium]|nr:hypothetical protein [Oscillospiraceae bacterium]